MSRGCPALASDAGGIPELLDAECLHKRGNVKQLAVQIFKSLDREWQKQQAQRNFETSKEYSREILQPRRDAFWNNVKISRSGAA